ncbi:activating transcription factor 7-interacting protein 2 [Rhinatrema bivittatum]|uniref:activating transcription factor 7-interacting protein 2 n=1 Tax=Rhinatrema bivittatum TaxID=194408 RepID=UPI001127971A|nr:activating transcription factor 7-interacting protein 2 [Rhinatrema bivittatum]XP_029432313.1 activating transcription factor 7-interacting protein 2 [Rhinatrema bivittatum]XP_029432315.1 activating transcription factor 7-interacting protein 2 [Rhinatrema bivittatum]XP_029432316.1 activating transcription factor 7-interacting protein 2 [Rhinatrema bivittatum]
MEISKNAAKKIFRARKTMNQSCRQQVETLNKRKDRTSKETYDMQFKKSVDIICKNYFAQENSVEVCSRRLNVSMEILDVDHQNETQTPLKGKSTLKKDNSANPKSIRCPPLQSILVDTVVNEAETVLSKPILQQNTSPPVLEKENMKFDAAHNLVTLNRDREDEVITDGMIPILEKVAPTLIQNVENEDLTIPILERFTMLEDPKATQPTEASCSDTVTDKCDLKHKGTIVCSVISSHGEDATAGDVNGKRASRPFQNVSTREVSPQDLISTESRSGIGQRKRIHSGNDENNMKKHQKTGNEKSVTSVAELEATKVCLEKVRCLIEQQIRIFFKNAFDQRLEELVKRVEQIQCQKKHEELAAKCLSKLHKIENRFNLLATRKPELQHQSMLPSKTDSSKVAITASDSDRSLHLSNKSEKLSPATSISSRITVKQTSTVKPESFDLTEAPNAVSSSQVRDKSKDPINLCDSDSDSSKSDSEDAKLKSVEALLSEVPKNSKTSGEQVPKVSSTNKEAKIQSENTALKPNIKQTQLVVDLTEDEDQQASEKDIPAKIPKVALRNNTVNILATGHESVASNDTSPTPSSSTSKKVETSVESIHSFSLLKTSQDPECPLEMNPLPPQKYELQLTQVLNPRGIALSWNVAEINPKCAAVHSYYLYMCQEPSKTNAPKWIKIGEIKALPLPMACTLTQFADGNKYHFTLRAKDIYGCFGPFCDVQSITLHLSDMPERS